MVTKSCIYIVNAAITSIPVTMHIVISIITNIVSNIIRKITIVFAETTAHIDFQNENEDDKLQKIHVASCKPFNIRSSIAQWWSLGMNMISALTMSHIQCRILAEMLPLAVQDF